MQINNKMKNYTASTKEIIIISGVFFLFLSIITIPIYVWFYGTENLKLFPDIPFLGSICIIIGIIFHEIIHAIIAIIYNKDGIKGVKLGVLWGKLTPYCFCKNTLLVWQYKLFLIMPFLILGVIPIIFSFLFDIFFLLIFGIIFSVGSTADLIIIYKISNLSRKNIVQDSSEECGCEVL